MERKKRGIFGFNIENGSVEVLYVPMDRIVANSEQPRTFFEDEAIEELSGSIKEYGVLQPILLRDDGKHYTIIAGERRWRAAMRAGLSKIPAIIKNMENKEAALVALVENVQREDLNFIEEAKGYKKLMDEFGLTQTEIAQKMNKKQSTISNKIRLLNLPQDIQESIVINKLTERHARALLKLEDQDERKQVIGRIVQNGLNVKQTEKLIEEIQQKKEVLLRKKKTINYISYKIYLNTLKKAFNQIKEMEKNAIFVQEDKGEFLEVRIVLPKKDRCFT